MLIATVGVDDVYGAVRFSFGSDLLRDGIDYLPVMIGVYAVTHVLVRFGARFAADEEAQPDPGPDHGPAAPARSGATAAASPGVSRSAP